MARKTKKRKGRGRKPKRTVSSKPEKTLYDLTLEAFKDKTNHVILCNLMWNVPMDAIEISFVFTQALKADIAHQRQKLRYQPRRQHQSSYRQHAHVLMELQSYKKKKFTKIRYHKSCYCVIRQLKSYATKNSTKTQEQEHQNYESTTMKT